MALKEKREREREEAASSSNKNDNENENEKDTPSKTQQNKTFSSSLSKFFGSGNAKPLFLFLGHLATILCSIAYILPLFGFQASYRFYRLCLQSVVATSVVKLHARNGFPPVSGIGFSKEALAMFFERMKNWFTPVQLSTDFHYMFVAMAVSSHPPFTIALAPFTCLALYHAITYMASSPAITKTFVWKKLLHKVFDALRNAQKEALVFNAAMEIGLFFSVVVRLFTRMRSIMLVFMIFNTLKMRYKSPESSYYHRMVWGHIDARFVQPYLIRFVPQLQQPLAYIQQFFLR